MPRRLRLFGNKSLDEERVHLEMNRAAHLASFFDRSLRCNSNRHGRLLGRKEKKKKDMSANTG